MTELKPMEQYAVRKGVVRVYRPQNAVELTISGGATPSDTSDEIRVEDALAMALTVKHNLTESDSTDLDVTIYTSENGSDFDTEPYGNPVNLGAAKRKTIPITPGPRFVKIKVENKDAGNSTKVTTYLTTLAAG